MKKENDYKNKMFLVLCYVILLFPIIGENIISTIVGDGISKIFSIFSCLFMLGYVFKQKKVYLCSFNINLLLLIILHIVIILGFKSSSTQITVANNMITPYGLIGYFMLFIFIDLHFSDINKLDLVFRSMMIVMTISVFLNFFITADLHIANNIAVFKEALSTGYTNSRKWLFGHRNMIFIHHLMWILFTYITYKLEKRNYSKMFVLQIIFTMLVGVVSWNSTMMLTTALLFVLAFFRNSIFSKSTIVRYVVIYLVLEIGIVFLRIQEAFSFIIVNVLHRNLSFTGRTQIWDYYINQFLSGNLLNKLFGNFGITELTVNSHNMFLGLLSFTGIIGIVLYFILLCLSIKELMKEKKSDTSKFISIIIFSFLINALTMEFYIQPVIAMFIGYRIKKINQLIAENQEE